MTRAELCAGITATETVRVLLAPFREMIVERAGRLRRESGIRLPDALIAATVVEFKLSLHTQSFGLRGPVVAHPGIG